MAAAGVARIRVEHLRRALQFVYEILIDMKEELTLRDK